MSDIPSGPPPEGYPTQPPLPVYGGEPVDALPGEPWRPTLPRAVTVGPARVAGALLLTVAGAGLLAAALASLATLRADDYAFLRDFSFVVRLQVAAGIVTPGALLVLPLALLLARGGEDHDGPPGGRARTVVVGVTAVGSGLAFLVFLRLVADLAGELAFAPAESRLGAFLYDLATLAVAVVPVWWGYAELQRGLPPASPGADDDTGRRPATAVEERPASPPVARPPHHSPPSDPSPWARPPAPPAPEAPPPPPPAPT